MHYFTFITNELALKNQLGKAAREFLQGKDRKIIPAHDLQNFKEEIDRQIEKLNEKYKRCNPLKPDWWKPHHENDWILTGVGSCTFTLLKSND